MHILMGIISLPLYTLYCSKTFCCKPIASAMARKCYELLQRYLQVVDNTSYNQSKDNKVFKIRPLLEAVRGKCVKVPKEEHLAIDQQIILSKIRFPKALQYNPKKPKKWDFKNLAMAGLSGFTYKFYLCGGKDDSSQNTKYSSLQKSAEVVARLGETIPGNIGHKLLFDN